MLTKTNKLTADMERVIVTPEMAMQLLEHNKTNRPVSTPHVHRIAAQIIAGKWRFNGDTIKVAKDGDVLDGQHRLWAVVEAKKPIDTIIIYGIERDAFATVDTLRKPRSGADILSLCGVEINKGAVSTALQWLIRYYRKALLDYKSPSNRIENSDIENTFAENRGIIRAVDRVAKLKGLYNRGILAFLYYIIYNRNPDLAERMICTLENPAGVSVNDPFFKLRLYFLNNGGRKDAIVAIAMAIKAANLAYLNKQTQNLSWKNQGKSGEEFPNLDVTKKIGGSGGTQ